MLFWSSLARPRAGTLCLALLLMSCAAPGPPTGALPGTSTGLPPVVTANPASPAEARIDAPAAPREWRAAWVATVVNIDWPSRPGLPADKQRAEVRALLDRARAIGLNAIVLQVRPAADAIYPSALEPWSEWLSGEQGRAPAPAYDPLALWVSEAHQRGIELHAWFNPYRARHTAAKSPASVTHVSRSKPELVRSYGDQQWFDPGEPSAAAHTLAVVADVARRYDIDGVHIDDYFYPYPLAGADGVDQPFPDDASWQRYIGSGGTLSRDDWRRDNVSRLVQALHDTVHRIKPQLRFGISPFGLGRPDLRPAGIEGFSQYDKLYADVERWVQQGWLDYLAPQLYWAIDKPGQAFAPLLDYWAAQLGGARHLWPGVFTSAIVGGVGNAGGGGARQWPADEVLAQIGLVRQRSAAGGHIHFSMVALMQDRDGVATRLRSGPYAQAALAPASPWLDTHKPSAPRAVLGQRQVTLLSADAQPPFLWAVWRRSAGQWRFATLPGHETTLALAEPGQPASEALVVSAVSRSGQESERVLLRVQVAVPPPVSSPVAPR